MAPLVQITVTGGSVKEQVKANRASKGRFTKKNTADTQDKPGGENSIKWKVGGECHEGREENDPIDLAT